MLQQWVGQQSTGSRLGLAEGYAGIRVGKLVLRVGRIRKALRAFGSSRSFLVRDNQAG